LEPFSAQKIENPIDTLILVENFLETDIKGLFLGSTYKLIHFPGVFVTGMGRYHMICVLGLFFVPKDRKPEEFLVMANNFLGKEVKASVVRNILFPTL
jgi:hypothetical protein